jgi:hypothetical protein
MTRNALQLLAAAVVAVILSGACMEPYSVLEDPVEYDAQGRRLVTVSVDLESAARAVNTPVAQAYIDFYEVVFENSTSTEFYAATTTKGAGKRLSLRVPAGNYTGYLYAGYLENNGDAVLLAQATVASQAASAAWNFILGALKLQVNGPTAPATIAADGTSDSDDPIYVTFDSGVAPIKMTSDGIPYYNPPVTKPVAVEVTTGVTTGVRYYSTGAVEVMALGRKTDNPPFAVPINASPVFDEGTGELTFGFTAPAAGVEAVSNVGFDVAVALASTTRNNKIEPVRWHIRNGLHVDAYDNGLGGATNTGAGIAFAFGSVKPYLTDVYINVTPPATVP